jgi:16S rRNA (adenine1518-N6/adenine1519-N6)-dimethyltransferase
MIQKEVAARLTASPGTSDYGAITAVLGYYGEVRKLFGVPASAFMPAPKVDSAVIRIDLYDEPPFHVEDKSFFFRVLHGAFEMRRKTLVNAVSAKVPELDKSTITRVLLEMGLSETIRGERLSTAQFADLSNRLFNTLK